jgi:PadR family transcriptional regulator, regulatory protein PadR
MREDTLEMLSTTWLVPSLLLLMRERDSYGQDLTRRTADLGLGAMRSEMVYRTLRQMEMEGIILSERDGYDCRLPRRKYSITEAGEDYLEFWASSLAEYREDMDLFLDVYAGGSGVRHADERRGRPGLPQSYVPACEGFVLAVPGCGSSRGRTRPGASEQAIVPQRAVEEGR